jgi:hypothetical protein
MMPKDSDMLQVGTEKDGILNSEYCNYCYVNRVSIPLDMQAFVKGVLKEQGVGKVKRWFYTIGIPKLNRWKK